MPEQELNLTLAADLESGGWEHDVFNPFGSPTFSPGASLLVHGIVRELTWSPTARQHFGSWLRFQLPLAVDDEILEARLIFHGHTEQSIPESYWNYVIRVKAHDVDDGVLPGTLAEISGWAVPANMTSAEALVTVPVFTSNPPGYTFFSPDITSIIREIIDRPGWVKDNHILFITKTKTPFHTDIGVPTLARVFLWGRLTQYAGQDNTDEGVVLYIRYIPGTNPPAGYDRNVVHDLTIEQDVVFVQLLRRGVEHELTFEQDITFVVVHNQTVEHTLDITHEMAYVQQHDKTVESLVVITQTIEGNRSHGETVEHTLDIQQDIRRAINLDQQVFHDLNIEQDIDWTYAYNKSVESVLEIEQIIDQSPKFRSIEHFLEIVQEYEHEGILQQPNHVEHTIEFEQDIGWLGSVFNRSLETELDIEQSCLGWLETINGEECSRLDLTYHPQAAEGVEFPEAPTLTPQDILLEQDVNSITLPRPLLANREELTLTRIQRRTRGGTLRMFRDDAWNKRRVFRYKFDSLPDAKIEEFFTFLGVTLGQEITLTDHEGRQWVGFIVNPQGESAQYFRMCGQTTEFDFDCIPFIDDGPPSFFSSDGNDDGYGDNFGVFDYTGLEFRVAREGFLGVTERTSSIRFTGAVELAGKTIVDAHLELYGGSSHAGNTTVEIMVEPVADAPQVIDASDLALRCPFILDNISWDTTGNTDGVLISSPNIGFWLQAVVNAVGFVGNINIFLKSSTISVTTFKAFESGAMKPKLVVTYSD